MLVNRMIVLVLIPAVAAAVQPRFHAEDVARQVREARPASPTQSLDADEFLIDTSITYVSAPDDQGSPAVGFDGASFFVVWQDKRGGSSDDVYGARVTVAGVVLDPAGIAVSTAANSQGSPAVAFDGASFLIVWQDDRSGSLTDIYGARVSRDGIVLDPAGIAVSIAANDQGSPAVAFDGASFLVVWQDERSGTFTDIYGARVGRDGIVLDPAGIAISAAADDRSFPAVAFDGTDFLVVWEDGRSGSFDDIYGARVGPAGVVLDSSGIPISAAEEDQGSPAVSFDGVNSLVVWQDERGGLSADVCGARVSPAGAVLDPAGIPISTAEDGQEDPAVSSDGTDFIVMWQDEREGSSYDLYGARVTAAGVVLDPPGIAVSTAAHDQWCPAVGFDGASFLVAWQDERGGSSADVYGARVTRVGAVLDTSGIGVSFAANGQWYPGVASDGTDFLVAWQDRRSGTSDDIYAARVTGAGVVLDPAGIAVSEATDDQWFPSAASDGTSFLLVWTDGRSGSGTDIYGARVTGSGVVLDPGGIAVCTAANGQWEPAVAFDGTNYLVVWHDYRSGSHPDVYGTRVTGAGVVLDPAGIAISAEADNQWYPAVVFDGSDFLVTWEDRRSGSTYDIYGARVSGAGVVLDPAGIPVSTAAYDQRAPAAAFDGTNVIVAWIDARSASYTDIYGARVAESGVVLDTSGFAICTAANDQWYPAAAFDGADFLVVWTDGRGGTYAEIDGARVTPGGVVADTFPVARHEGNRWSGALAVAPGGQTFLACGGWVSTAAGKTYNTYRVLGKLGPFPGVEESPRPQAASSSPAATIVRGVLFLPQSPVANRQSPSALLDISGREVLALRPGANDVRHLAPGVYFVRTANGEERITNKVVITG